MNSNIKKILEKIKEEINREYGFHDGTPRINYGPCGVFAKIFLDKWNALFDKKSHICFILTPSKDECDHIVVRLPSGELYDGGIGIHSDDEYLNKFLIDEMTEYDEHLLEKWSYGLDRKYPRFCPNFNREKAEKIIHSNLNELFKLTRSFLEIDENIATNIAASMLGEKVLSSIRLTTGDQHFVFAVKTESEEYVLRMTNEENRKFFISAIYWQEKLIPLGMPLAKFIKSDLNGEYSSFPALLMMRLPGDDLCNVYSSLTNLDKENLAKEIVAIQNKTKELPNGNRFWNS